MDSWFGLSPYLFTGLVILTVVSLHMVLAPFLTFLLLYRTPDERRWLGDIHKVWFIPVAGSLWMAFRLWRARNDVLPIPEIEDDAEAEIRPVDLKDIDWSREIRALQRDLGFQN